MAVESFSKEALESKYRLLLSWRYSTLEYLGLPTFQDERPVSLEAIYVSTRLTWTPDGKEPSFLSGMLRQHKHLVVLGDAGSGKSTLIQMIAYSLGRTEPTPLSRMLGPLIPIPVILRDYKTRRWHGAEDMLRDFIGSLDPEIRDHASVEWLLEVLRTGRGALLLDGLDEVGPAEDRRQLRDEVVIPLLRAIPGSIVLLTTRSLGYDEVPFDELVLPGAASEARLEPPRSSFRRCHMAPFGEEEIREYTRRWYSVREPNAARRQEGIASLTAAILQNQRVRDLAAKPGLLAMMALIHRVTGTLPLDRLKLYDKIVEAYLESLQIYRNLPRFHASLEEMKQWLARVGWEMQCRSAAGESQLSAPPEQMAGWVAEALEGDGAQQTATSFIEYLARRAGLLVARGPAQIAFAHVSFQEYFAAWHLRGKLRRFEGLVAECLHLVANTQWHETLVLLFGMLAEFSGAVDDLAHEIASRTAGDDSARPAAAELFVRLLAADVPGLRAARREVSELVFLAWSRKELGYIGDLGPFFTRFAEEFEKWTLQKFKEAPADQRLDAARRVMASFARMGELLSCVGATQEARRAYQKSVDFVQRLLVEEPERGEYLRELSGAFESIGDVLQCLGEWKEARNLYEQALVVRRRLVAREPDRSDYVLDLSTSLNSMGDLLRESDEREKARELYRHSLEIARRLVAQDPNRPDYLHKLAASLDRMGDVLQASGQPEQQHARECYEEALEIGRSLVAQEPGDSVHLRNLAVSLTKMGDLLRGSGERDEARRFYQQALDITQRLTLQEPERTDYLRDLSVTFNRIGDVLREGGDSEQARHLYQQDLAICQRLVAREPDRTDYLRDLSVSLERMGEVLRESGDRNQARNLLQQALAIRERLLAQEPNQADYLRSLSVSLILNADLLRDSAEHDQARELYGRALEIHQRLAALEPGRTDYLEDLRICLDRMALIMADLGGAEEAARYHRQAEEVAVRLATRPKE